MFSLIGLLMAWRGRFLRDYEGSAPLIYAVGVFSAFFSGLLGWLLGSATSPTFGWVVALVSAACGSGLAVAVFFLLTDPTAEPSGRSRRTTPRDGA